jgi:hypothetical protein
MKWENETCECVKWLKGAELEDFEDLSVMWTAHINGKNETAIN